MTGRSTNSDSKPPYTGETPAHRVRMTLFVKLGVAFSSAFILLFGLLALTLSRRIADDVTERLDRQVDQLLLVMTYQRSGAAQNSTLIPLGEPFASQALGFLKERFAISDTNGGAVEFVVFSADSPDELSPARESVVSTLSSGDSQLISELRAKRASLPNDGGGGTIAVGGMDYRFRYRSVFVSARNQKHDIYALYPTTIADASRRRALQPFRAWLAGGLTLMIGVSFILGKRLLRPVKTLSDAAARVASGDLDARVNIDTGDELQALGDSFNAMTASLRKIRLELLAAERLAAIGRMSATMAHEIRNPLASISMTIQRLQKTLNDPRDRDSVTIAFEEIERLGRYTQDLLDFAKPSDPVLKPVDLGVLITETIELHQQRFGHSGVSIERDLSDSLPSVDADASMVRRMLTNLLLNARQAIRGEGKIRVIARAEPIGDTLTIRIEDDGAGIDPAIIDRLFEPFFTTKESGAGIGLAMVKQAVDAHGWRIRCDNRIEQRGAEFIIDIPLKKR